MSVAKGSDELWEAVKCQTNSAIAGSPRNRLRASLESEAAGGRALSRCGPSAGTKPSQTPNAGSRARELASGG